MKLRTAIIGPGNIGIDLMMKVLKKNELELVMMAGVDPDSPGLKMAAERGIKTSLEGIHGILNEGGIDIVFDATGAKAHSMHAPLLKKAGIFAIDLTPAAVGPYCVPCVNMVFGPDVDNVNLVTCGGQATIPVVAAINSVTPVEYAEIVATIASRSAGPGTRQNIDEFTETTAEALVKIGGARKGKAIILLNPAEPPLMMRNTIYCQCDAGRIAEISQAIETMVEKVKEYVPGYHLKVPPYADGDFVVAMVEVEGAGDYLPKHTGNLDIITSAAVAIAADYAARKAGGAM